MRQFRRGENPKSPAYTENLNELIRVALKVEGLHNLGPGLKIDNQHNRLTISLPRKRNEGGGGSASGAILFGQVTQSLKYADEESIGISRYKATIPDVGSDINIGIWNESLTADLRAYTPWIPVGDSANVTQPILLFEGNYYFMSNSFNYVGTNVEKSISWNEEKKLLQSVFA